MLGRRAKKVFVALYDAIPAVLFSVVCCQVLEEESVGAIHVCRGNVGYATVIPHESDLRDGDVFLTKDRVVGDTELLCECGHIVSVGHKALLKGLSEKS